MNHTISIHSDTPTLSVIDNQGLPIRTLEYNRVKVEDSLDECITSAIYGLSGHLESSLDPRLFLAYQRGEDVVPNIRHVISLKGEPLLTESVDAGKKIVFYNIDGKQIWHMNANGTQTTMTYDGLGRPTAIFENQGNEAKTRCTDRFIYGEHEEKAEANNLRGQLVRHYDTAGLIQTKSFSLADQPRSQTRQLLKNMEKPSNWETEDDHVWESLLDDTRYQTSWLYDIQGKVLAQKDAKGNIQQTTYNVMGQTASTSVTLKGQPEQSIIKRIEYNASGQRKLTEAGNGVVTQYTYEEKTQRLMRKKDFRMRSSGVSDTLQDHHYEYDPVGNVLSITNGAESPQFFRNQVIHPKREYQYDTLYQLVSSTGRECQTKAEGQYFPAAITPMDASQLANYTENYEYDRGGNLIKLSHQGANAYTRKIKIDNQSNRGMWHRQEQKAPNIEETFDQAGNLKYLRPGIPLQWDNRNQLSCVQVVSRENGEHDSENYFYDGSGMRLIKQYTKKSKNTTQTGRVIYLPGLELRIRKTGDRVTESMQVITAGDVRVLHWEGDTKPADIDNNQYRYSLNDHIGSSLLELDQAGKIISQEEFYPYGATAWWTARTKVEASYKTIRYSGKELDATGLYYYGFRYYMPWLGRWLNPDPAGTVDGLNLYRMVRNNPITLMDPDGNAPIDPSDYRAENGDLIYGLSDARGLYKTKLNPYYLPNNSNSPPMIIDEYNNHILGLIYQEQDRAIQNGLSDDTKNYARRVKVPKNLKDMTFNSSKGKYPLWKDYFEIGMNKPKLNIANIYKETGKKYGSDYYHEWVTRRLANRLLWKRGSKIGIEVAATNQKTKIHFVLDGLDVKSVVNKVKENHLDPSKPGPGQSITASELRYIYRNWDRLSNNVIFYRNNEKVNAPWEENHSLWSQYTSPNLSKKISKTSRVVSCNFL